MNQKTDIVRTMEATSVALDGASLPLPGSKAVAGVECNRWTKAMDAFPLSGSTAFDVIPLSGSTAFDVFPLSGSKAFDGFPSDPPPAWTHPPATSPIDGERCGRNRCELVEAIDGKRCGSNQGSWWKHSMDKGESHRWGKVWKQSTGNTCLSI